MDLEDLLKFFLFTCIIFLLFTPFVVSITDRVESLEKLHNNYVCLECNSLVQK